MAALLGLATSTFSKRGSANFSYASSGCLLAAECACADGQQGEQSF